MWLYSEHLQTGTHQDQPLRHHRKTSGLSTKQQSPFRLRTGPQGVTSPKNVGQAPTDLSIEIYKSGGGSTQIATWPNGPDYSSPFLHL